MTGGVQRAWGLPLPKAPQSSPELPCTGNSAAWHWPVALLPTRPRGHCGWSCLICRCCPPGADKARSHRPGDPTVQSPPPLTRRRWPSSTSSQRGALSPGPGARLPAQPRGMPPSSAVSPRVAQRPMDGCAWALAQANRPPPRPRRDSTTSPSRAMSESPELACFYARRLPFQ